MDDFPALIISGPRPTPKTCTLQSWRPFTVAEPGFSITPISCKTKSAPPLSWKSSSWESLGPNPIRTRVSISCSKTNVAIILTKTGKDSSVHYQRLPLKNGLQVLCVSAVVKVRLRHSTSLDIPRERVRWFSHGSTPGCIPVCD